MTVRDDYPTIVTKEDHVALNWIEEMNGTLRERVRVQRGWKSMKTQLAEGQRIQYNFVKPHAALDGQTHARAAGVGLGSKNKWMEMLARQSPAMLQGAKSPGKDTGPEV